MTKVKIDPAKHNRTKGLEELWSTYPELKPGRISRKRDCLRCDKSFISNDLGNRLCDRCRIAVDLGHSKAIAEHSVIDNIKPS